MGDDQVQSEQGVHDPGCSQALDREVVSFLLPAYLPFVGVWRLAEKSEGRGGMFRDTMHYIKVSAYVSIKSLDILHRHVVPKWYLHTV